jgi:two-component system, OmpR family, sensor kinase
VNRLPIRVRLTLAFAAAMAAVLAGVGLFVYHRVGTELLSTVDQTLAAQSREALSHTRIDVDAGGGTTLAQVFRANGSIRRSEPVRMRPLVSPGVLTAAPATGRVWLDRQLPGRRGEWRLLIVRSPAGTTVAVVARSLTPRAESLDHLRHELVIFLSLALLAASLGGYGLAAGALRPVEILRRRAEMVTAGEARTLPIPPARDEISRLAATLNDMLARLHAAVEHERRFVADASHELRTPLALLRTELDLALRRPRPHKELEDALRSAAVETQRLSRLAEDLLLIARSDQGSLPIHREILPAEELLADAAERFAGRAETLGRTLHVEPAQVYAHADPARVGQALVNLIENALTHGSGPVELAAEERDGFVELHVRDEGDGFPEGFRELAFHRFSRADEARSRGGSGLGLSIVELVARAHGGRAGLSNRPGGGADVWLAVPRADVAKSPDPDEKRAERPHHVLSA